jgi:PAS domain S-box-containing protein
MSVKTRKPRGPRPLRELAETRLAGTAGLAYEDLTPDGIRRVIHELEVHQVELEIQNQQLVAAQLAAQESEDRYRRLYESAPVGFLTLDPEGVIMGANRFAAGLFQVSLARLIGRTLSSFITERDQDRWYFARRALIERAARQSFDLAVRLEDGHELDLQIIGSGRSEGSETLSVALLDVTELRTAERALRRAAAEAALAEERERRKLASDLHDESCQLLSLAAVKLRALADAMGSEWSVDIQEVTGILAEVRGQLTSLTFQLSPPLLHDVGLVAATRWLAEDLKRRYDLAVEVAAEEEIVTNEATRITVFRAIRELLVNTSKHAGVAEARVRIWREDTALQIAVEDDGVGFPRDPGRGGFGLTALRERIDELGGTLVIGSGPDGRGSRIVARVPDPIREEGPA